MILDLASVVLIGGIGLLLLVLRNRLDPGLGLAAGLLLILFFLIPAASRSEEHTSELQSLIRISYDVFCLKKKKTTYTITQLYTTQQDEKIIIIINKLKN